MTDQRQLAEEADETTYSTRDRLEDAFERVRERTATAGADYPWRAVDVHGLDHVDLRRWALLLEAGFGEPAAGDRGWIADAVAAGIAIGVEVGVQLTRQDDSSRH